MFFLFVMRCFRPVRSFLFRRVKDEFWQHPRWDVLPRYQLWFAVIELTYALSRAFATMVFTKLLWSKRKCTEDYVCQVAGIRKKHQRQDDAICLRSTSRRVVVKKAALHGIREDSAQASVQSLRDVLGERLSCEKGFDLT